MRRSIPLGQSLLLIIILVGVALRLEYINRSMRFDEALTIIEFGTVNPLTTIASYVIPNNHIFHSLLVNLSYRLGGLHPMFMRLPVFIAGVLLIPMTYRAAKSFYKNEQVGLLAAVLVAISPILIDFSVTARGYQIQAFLVMLMLNLAHRLKTQDSTPSWLLLGILAAICFFTLPTTIYPMGFIALWLLMSIWIENKNDLPQRTTLLKNFIISMTLGAVLTIILYTPVILFTGLDRLGSDPAFASYSFGEFLNRYPNLWMGMFSLIHWHYPDWLMIISLGLLLLGIIRHAQLSQDAVPLGVIVLVWLLISTLFLRVLPFQRVWLFLVPVYAMLLAAGFTYVLRWIPKSLGLLFIAGLAMIGGLYAANNDTIRLRDNVGLAENAEAGAFYLSDNLSEDEVVLMSWPTNYPVYYYVLLHDLPFPQLGSDDLTTLDSYYQFYHLDDELSRLQDGGVPAGQREVIQHYEFGTIEKISVESPQQS